MKQYFSTSYRDIKKEIKKTFFFLSLLFICSHSLLAQSLKEIPELKTRVTDITGTLTSSEIYFIEHELQILEQQKGAQMVVVIVSSTQPEPIEEYTMRLARNWKIGRAKTDDGVVLLVAKEDRKVRIEVGYGLEGAIPDAIAKRIIDEQIVPRFKIGDFFGGISSGVSALASMVKGEAQLPPSSPYIYEVTDNVESNDGPNPAVFLIVLFTPFICIAEILKYFYGNKGKYSFAALIFLVAFIVEGIAFGFFYTIVFLLFSIPSFGGGRRSGNSRSGWRSYGGGYGGGGFSGGGFSGGGGSFGGGGASGGW